MKQSDARSAWYGDNYSAQPRRQPQTAKPRKKHRGLKITMIILCVLVLIVGSVAVFSGIDIRMHYVPDGKSESDEGFGYSFDWPPVGGELPEDFDNAEDFFRNYYTDTETLEPSAIDRTEPLGDWTLTLNTADGLPRLTLQELYDKCAESIVSIEAFSDKTTGYFWGTGIVLTEDGYILTNQHVISGTQSATVLLADGMAFEALLVGEDKQTDLAVLKIEAEGLIPAEFGDSAELTVGDDVAAIGNPLGSELIGTMTNGIISAINRDINMNGRRMVLLQTTAAINEGNSGGALINMYGQVIGVTNMKMGSYYSSVAVEGLGFAIPSTTAKTIVDQIIAGGKVAGRPGLGITVGVIPDEAKAQYGLPEGLYITAVSEGSDAQKQGIRMGDVLQQVNGQTVVTTQDVLDIRDTCAVGDTMVLTIWRNGQTLDIPVTLYDQNDIY